MAEHGDGDGFERDAGIPVERIVDAVATGENEWDPADVRGILDVVARDGVVTGGGIRTALGEVSVVVSTPATRGEFAGIGLADAREAAEDVADVDAVRSRLDAFGARLGAVVSRVDELDERLRTLVDRTGDCDPAADPVEAFEVAREIRDLETAANGVQRGADELAMDLEAFVRWVADPAVRADDLEGDLDALALALDELAAGVDDLTASADAVADRDESDGDDGTADEVPDAVRWFDLALRHRVLALLAADLRAELDDCRTLAARNDDSGDRLSAVETRLDDLRERRRSLGERLDGVGRPAWRERFDGRLHDFETALDAYDPPVEWAAVGETLEAHRPDGADRR